MVVPNLDPRRLLIFREVGHAGSLSAAAHALGWSQPAVGQHVGRLERDTGLALVTRTSRGTKLTSAGQTLLAHADTIADQVAAAGRAMARLREPATGALRLAAYASGCLSLVPELMSRLRLDIADLELTLRQADYRDALQMLREGVVDLALLTEYDDAAGVDSRAAPSRNINFVRVLRDPLVALVPKDHILANRAGADVAIPLRILADQKWIVGSAARQDYFVKVCAEAGFTPGIVANDGGDLIVRSMVESGMGIGLIPSLSLAGASNDLVAVRIDPSPAQNVIAAYRSDGTTPSAATHAVQQLRLTAQRRAQLHAAQSA